MEYLAPQGVTVVEAKSADICAAASDADVVLAETPVNPGLDVVDLHHLAMTCRGCGATDRRQHYRDTARPAAAVARCRRGEASATKALSGHSDLVAGYVAGSQPELMQMLERDRLKAGRFSARSRRGWCCAASAAQACASNGSVRTLRRSP